MNSPAPRRTCIPGWRHRLNTINLVKFMESRVLLTIRTAGEGPRDQDHAYQRRTRRSTRATLAAIALASGAAGLIAGPAGASNTQVSAVGSLTTFTLMRALFPVSINNVNPNPLTGSATETIAADPLTCSAGVTYSTALQPPNGSGAGKTALAAEEAASTTSQGCIDLVRVASPPAPHAETLPSGGAESGDPSGSHFDYYAYGLDGFDPLLGSNAGGTAASPATVSLTQLQEIYSCWNSTTSSAVTTWAQAGIGSSTATIVRYWPQTGSGVRSVYTDILGFDPTVLTNAVNHCATAPTTGFTSGSTTYPEEQDAEDGIIYNQVVNGVSDANAIYIYSAGKFAQEWNNPTAYNSTATNAVAVGLGHSPSNIGNFDTSLTLANIYDTGATPSGHSFVNYTPVHSHQGTMSLNASTVNEANEWYTHLPAGDTTNPSDSTAAVPGVVYVYNIADTQLPSYNGAKALTGFDNQVQGPESALCHGDDSSIIAAQGFLPLSNNGASTAPAGSDVAGATCREFIGLSYPGKATGMHWLP